MANNPTLPQRQSLRLKEYDYTQPGAYFVTLVTWQRKCLLGDIVQEKIQLNLLGKIAANKLLSLPKHFPVAIDSWIVMPNHIHVIFTLTDPCAGEATAGRVLINNAAGAVASPLHNLNEINSQESFNHNYRTPPQNGTRSGSLGAIIQNYKSVTSKQINRQNRTPGAPIWQRNYYERIIRNEIEMNNIHLYIVDNPRRWLEDPENK